MGEEEAAAAAAAARGRSQQQELPVERRIAESSFGALKLKKDALIHGTSKKPEKFAGHLSAV